MNNNKDHLSQELFEAIDRYITGEMTEDERIIFEDRIQADEVLKSNVEEQRDLIRAVEESALLEWFNNIHHRFFGDGKQIGRKGFFSFSARMYFLAASIILFLAIGSYFLFFHKNFNERLYATYFKPDPGLPTVMGTSENFAFYDAMVDYKRGKYEKAIQKWEKQQIQKSENDTLNYFLGVAYLANDNPEKAVLYLEVAVKTKNFIFIDDANYYLGMAFLKKGNIEKSRAYFSLSGSKKAKELINKIDN
jgi:tetratricopeptide (TPR) repeat protein